MRQMGVVEEFLSVAATDLAEEGLRHSFLLADSNFVSSIIFRYVSLRALLGRSLSPFHEFE